MESVNTQGIYDHIDLKKLTPLQALKAAMIAYSDAQSNLQGNLDDTPSPVPRVFANDPVDDIPVGGFSEFRS